MAAWDSALTALSPILWWKMNEASGSTITDYGSGTLNGTIIGSPVLGATGLILTSPTETSYSWNSASYYAYALDAADLDFGTTSFTFGCWVEFPTTPSINLILNKENQSASAQGWALFTDGDDIVANICDGTNDAQVIGVFTNSTPTLVIGVVDRSGGNLHLYVNGSASGSPSSLTSVGSVSSTYPVVIGLGSSATATYLQSQVFVIGSALTSTQVSNLYAAASAEIGGASQSISLTSAAGGLVKMPGSGSQTLTLSSSAGGAVKVPGSGAQTISLTATAAGSTANPGNGSQTISLSGTAGGVVQAPGGAAQTMSLTATASGAVQIGGSAAETATLTATASGTLAGAAAETATLTSTAGGHVGVAGSASETMTLSATAAGKSGIPGSGSQTSTLAGSASGAVAQSILLDSNVTGNYEIYMANTNGTGLTKLTNNATYDSWWPQLSPSGTEILFYRVPAGTHDTDPADNQLWKMNVDGTGETLVLGAAPYTWAQQGHVSWSPDGTKLVMFGGSIENPQIFVTNADGTSPTAVTAISGASSDPSWDPSDGTGRIYYINDGDVYSLSPVSISSTPVRLTTTGNNYDPYASPDGTKVAFLQEVTSPYVWAIGIMNPDGSDSGYVINDGNLNSKPNWDVGGGLIYFHRIVIGTDSAFGIWAIEPNGTNLTELIPPSGSDGYEYPDTGILVRGASQTMSLSATAAGVVNTAVAGDGAQTITLTSTAAGLVKVPGSAAQTISLTSAANGSVVVAGSAAQAISLTSAATGKVSVAGSASQSISLVSSAAGIAQVSGSGAFTASLTSTATGRVVMAASASATISLTAAVVGSVSVPGSSNAVISLSASAAGLVKVPANAGFTVSLSALATGLVVVKGTASEGFSLTSTAIGGILGGAQASASLTAIAIGQVVIQASGQFVATAVTAASGTLVFTLKVGHQSMALAVQPAMTGKQQELGLVVQPALQ